MCVTYTRASYMSTHQVHTDASQARTPTCYTACTHMGTHTQATCYMHTFTTHTLPQHTPTHSIHMYQVFTHPYNMQYMYIFFQIRTHTPCLPPSKVPCLHGQTHDIHTNTDPANHVFPVPSLPSGPLGSPTLLNSSLRQVT